MGGDFNGWAPVPMARSGEEWVLSLPLRPGVYRYATTGDTILRNVQPLFAELEGIVGADAGTARDEPSTRSEAEHLRMADAGLLADADRDAGADHARGDDGARAGDGDRATDPSRGGAARVSGLRGAGRVVAAARGCLTPSPY